jgi:ribonuclease P protein component
MPAPEKLKKRKDFIKASKIGISIPTQSIIIQAAENMENTRARIGYTTTKKLGKAVIRNRCRRRLRAVAAIFFEKYAEKGTDYVLIGRYNTADICFETLCKDFIYGIKKANKTLYGVNGDDKQDNKLSVSIDN